MSCSLTAVTPCLRRHHLCLNTHRQHLCFNPHKLVNNSWALNLLNVIQTRARSCAQDFSHKQFQARPLSAQIRAGCSQEARNGSSELVVVRQAVLDDLDALVAVEDGSRPGGHWGRSSLQAELERERATVVVAEKAQQPVGLLVVWTIPPDELHVLELAVLPSHRRQGVAKQMLAWAFHKHRDQAGVAMLEVRKSNCAAQQLYQGFGFEAVGERKRYYEDGEDAVLMNMDLHHCSRT